MTTKSISVINSLILNAGSGFDAYLWSTYTTGSTYTVNSSVNGFGVKKFSVKVTQNACYGYDTIVVTINKYNSIKTISGIDLNVFPSPVHNFLNISTEPNGKGISITLSDMNGKQLKTMTIMPDNISSVYQMDVSEFAEGIYYLNISNREYRKIIKIVKY